MTTPDRPKIGSIYALCNDRFCIVTNTKSLPVIVQDIYEWPAYLGAPIGYEFLPLVSYPTWLYNWDLIL